MFLRSKCCNLTKKYLQNITWTSLKFPNQKNDNYAMFVALSVSTFLPIFKSQSCAILWVMRDIICLSLAHLNFIYMDYAKKPWIYHFCALGIMLFAFLWLRITNFFNTEFNNDKVLFSQATVVWFVSLAAWMDGWMVGTTFFLWKTISKLAIRKALWVY